MSTAAFERFIGLRVTLNEYELLKRLAKRGQSMSGVLREALRLYAKQQQK